MSKPTFLRVRDDSTGEEALVNLAHVMKVSRDMLTDQAVLYMVDDRLYTLVDSYSAVARRIAEAANLYIVSYS